MTEKQIRFEDGAGYERMMGVWTQIVGNVFLDWLSPPRALRWLDVGCGTGAFTEQLIERAAPLAIDGIDPSDAQLAFASARPGARLAQFHRGDAMALPFADRSFDAAVMALVIFFLPDPARGVQEMARVVRPGGIVAAYAWDVMGGGLPIAPIHAVMRAMDIKPLLPPRPEAAETGALRALWTQCGLEAVETREFAVTRLFADFEDFWSMSLHSANLGSLIGALPPNIASVLKERVRLNQPLDATGRIISTARAHAIRGRMPE
jgi:SAM-dependent methyltransferase